MKKFHIVTSFDYFIEDLKALIEEATEQLYEGNEEDTSDTEYKGQLAVLEKYENGFDVETFEEYYNIVTELNEQIGGVHISNGGLYIGEW